MIIEEMTKKDIDEIVKIEEESFSQPWTRENFIHSLSKENNLFLVAKIEDEILGYCGCARIFDEGHIYNIAIKKQYRGRQIGKTLLEEIFRRFNKKEVYKFTLEVRVGNTRAIKLYEKLGFKIAGIRSNYYAQPTEDAAIMWKE